MKLPLVTFANRIFDTRTSIQINRRLFVCVGALRISRLIKRRGRMKSKGAGKLSTDTVHGLFATEEIRARVVLLTADELRNALEKERPPIGGPVFLGRFVVCAKVRRGIQAWQSGCPKRQPV